MFDKVDIKMPDMDGHELFSKIHELDNLAKVVLITGHEDILQTVDAKSNGLLGMLIKPTEIQILKNIIQKNEC